MYSALILQLCISAGALAGLVLDFFFGDPPQIPHPVVLMGKVISRLEEIFREKLPAGSRGEFLGGLLLAVILPLGTLTVSGFLCFLAWEIHPVLFVILDTFWCWQCLAARGLRTESANVYRCLRRKGLPAARKALSRIVGRDTEALDEEHVIRAAVETVAENFSDGVLAPLLYMLIGGAPLALTYKSINTMDSMVGYKNERYLHFGCAPAHLDDGANFLPSRLAALLWILAACLGGYDGENAWRIWRRDSRNHASPNAAQTESACAGSLDIELAGPAYYFGEYYDKPTIGDPVRPVHPMDILRADRMMYLAAVLGCLLLLELRALVLLVIF